MTAAEQWIEQARSLTQSSSVPLGVPIATHMDMLLRDTHRALRDACNALEAVLAAHKPHEQQVITGDCATEECGHEDECPTVAMDVCTECHRIADEAYPWYGEQGMDHVAHPCQTRQAITSALTPAAGDPS